MELLFCTAIGPIRGFPGGTVVKNLPANAGNGKDRGSLGQEDPLEKKRATHSSILA